MLDGGESHRRVPRLHHLPPNSIKAIPPMTRMIPTTTAITFRRVMITLRMNPAKRTRIIAPIMIISAPIMADLCTPSSVYLDIYAKMSSEHMREITDLEQAPGTRLRPQCS